MNMTAKERLVIFPWSLTTTDPQSSSNETVGSNVRIGVACKYSNCFLIYLETGVHRTCVQCLILKRDLGSLTKNHRGSLCISVLRSVKMHFRFSITPNIYAAVGRGNGTRNFTVFTKSKISATMLSAQGSWFDSRCRLLRKAREFVALELFTVMGTAQSWN